MNDKPSSITGLAAPAQAVTAPLKPAKPLQGQRIVWLTQGEELAIGMGLLLVLGSLIAAYLPGGFHGESELAQRRIIAGYVVGALSLVAGLWHAGWRWGEPYGVMAAALDEGLGTAEEKRALEEFQEQQDCGPDELSWLSGPIALMERALTHGGLRFQETAPSSCEVQQLGSDTAVTYRRCGLLVKGDQVCSPEFQLVLECLLVQGQPSDLILELQDTHNNWTDDKGTVHLKEGGLRWQRAYDSAGNRED
jgi:hypothetical protein